MVRSTRRGPWLPQEDATLLHLVHLSGPNNWVRISQHMQHRSPKQCRERYHQNLKPSLNHEPISNDEGELIEQLVQEIGKRWAEIARRLGNRSDNAVKNWWNGSMNRRRRTTTSHGMSRVGPRSLPISAATTPRQQSSSLVHGHHHHHHHHHHHLLSEAHPPPSLYEPVSRPLSSAGPLSLTPGEPLSPLLQHSPPRPLHASSEQQHARPAVRPSLPSPSFLDLTGAGACVQQRHSQAAGPSAGSIPRHLSSGEQQQQQQQHHHHQHQQHTEWSLPRLVDLPPIISPATTEFSSTGSARQPPSLVSDSLSNYSISPKTVSSPPPPPTTAGGSRTTIGQFNETGSDDFTLDPCPSKRPRRLDEQLSSNRDSRMSVSRLLD